MLSDSILGRSAVLAWDYSALLRVSFTPLFRAYVYLLVLLPTGSIFGVNVKIICFLLLFPPALLHLVQNGRTTLMHLCALVCMPVVFMIWLVVSQAYGVESALAIGQYRELIITLVSCWVAAVFCGQGAHATIRFLRTVLHAEVCASVLKIFLLVFAAYRGIPVSSVVNGISDFFGVQLMGLDFESSLGRIQFVADGLIPVCMYLLLQYRHRLGISSVFKSLVAFGFLASSLVFTFSRYFWAFGLLAVALGLFVSKKDRFHFTLMIALAGAVTVTFPVIASIAALRFSSDVAGGSDDVRVLQTPPLTRYFLDAPILGHGFGSHTGELLRSIQAPYTYEAQIYALAGQIGIVGMCFLLCLVGYYFHHLWIQDSFSKLPTLVERFALTVLLVAWLAAGFFNPMLLSSAAALCYASIRALATLAGHSFPESPGRSSLARSGRMA